ncbi:anthranilate phosphoribosyltransferase [Limnochorda pilosa]|uniref:Anthranilate phosphoribosyltransferase n=1 Tax=Limnochorda pilosa TaxID=1555112 RepID=A0A0K2SKE9_LIMPI|nr:anthranilate phosphoribosyltransferase [Limnochorda pilosa]BAS27586.1 anthranilate phosphoribosyltransferase [Limnochorda pilosa]
MIREAIGRLVAGERLAEDEAAQVMEEIMTGGAQEAQVAGYLTALRLRGETVEVITGSARAMREKAVRIQPKVEPLVDTCGTGGDGAGTINISTAAALVAAGAGVKVAKHGNRGVSSPSGSADVLEALGVRVDLEPEEARRCIEEVGIGFLFAPRYHPGMRFAAPTRKALGIRTLFNLLGPLANPAGADRQVMGVFDGAWVEPVARVLARLGCREAMVVHGLDGTDELSISGPTRVAHLREGAVHAHTLEPEDAGLTRHPPAAVRGGSPQENARRIRRVLEGSRDDEAVRDVVLLNAAAALVVAGRAASLRDGVGQAAGAIDSGAAWERLEALRRFTGAPPEAVA